MQVHLSLINNATYLQHSYVHLRYAFLRTFTSPETLTFSDLLKYLFFYNYAVFLLVPNSPITKDTDFKILINKTKVLHIKSLCSFSFENCILLYKLYIIHRNVLLILLYISCKKIILEKKYFEPIR